MHRCRRSSAAAPRSRSCPARRARAAAGCVVLARPGGAHRPLRARGGRRLHWSRRSRSCPRRNPADCRSCGSSLVPDCRNPAARRRAAYRARARRARGASSARSSSVSSKAGRKPCRRTRCGCASACRREHGDAGAPAGARKLERHAAREHPRGRAERGLWLTDVKRGWLTPRWRSPSPARFRASVVGGRRRVNEWQTRSRNTGPHESPLIASALRTLETEAGGIAALVAAIRDGLGAPFAAAVELIARSQGPADRHRHGQVRPCRAQDRRDLRLDRHARLSSCIRAKRATATSA